MNTKNIVTIVLVLSLAVATNAINAVGKLILHNNTGWDLKYKFAEPERAAREGVVANNNSVSLGDTDDYGVRALSIRRSGVGSSVTAPWSAIDVKTLIADSGNMMRKPLPNSNVERNLIWEIYAGNLYGWGITVKEFISNKVGR